MLRYSEASRFSNIRAQDPSPSTAQDDTFEVFQQSNLRFQISNLEFEIRHGPVARAMIRMKGQTI